MSEKINPNWLEATRSYTKCPKCEKGLLDTRIPRSFLYKYVFVWADVKRFKCNNCMVRLHLPSTLN
jgi:hypothetical protein